MCWHRNNVYTPRKKINDNEDEDDKQKIIIINKQKSATESENMKKNHISETSQQRCAHSFHPGRHCTISVNRTKR